MDYDELRKEIRKFRIVGDGTSGDEVDDDGDSTREDPGKCVHLLKAWSGNIAQRIGLQVFNLTTSFADGTIFASVLDEYLPCLSKTVALELSGKQCPLDARLRATGCSPSFGKSSQVCEICIMS